MPDLSNIVLLRAKAGKSAALGIALKELVTLTVKEPGCAINELTQSVDDPDTWMVYERWRGQAALDSHMRQPYVKRFLDAMGDLLSEPPSIRSYNFRG